MTAGLPGISITGVFYFFCVLFMPIQELVNAIKGKTTRKRWGTILKQVIFLCGMMAGFWCTGLLLGIVISKAHAAHANGGSIVAMNAFGMKPMYISLLTLAAVLCAIRIINFFFDLQSPRGRAQK